MIGNPEALILQKAFEPEEAARILDYIDSSLAGVQDVINSTFQE